MGFSRFRKRSQMATSATNSSVPPIPSFPDTPRPDTPRPDTPRHDQEGDVVQLYTDDSFLIDVLSRFVGGALAVGDSAIVIATESHQRQLEKHLSARGLDTIKANLQGRYITLDASQALPRFMENGTVDETRFKAVIDGLLR